VRYLVACSEWIDRITAALGRGLRWIALALVALGVINVVGRYLGAQIGVQLSSNALLEAQTQAFNLLFLLGAAWLMQRDAHIRVDILYAGFGRRVQLWIDIVGHTLLLVPFCCLMIALTWGHVVRAWQRLEVSPNPGGLPLYPIKTVLLIAFVLLLLQALSEIIKRIQSLRDDDGTADSEAR